MKILTKLLVIAGLLISTSAFASNSLTKTETNGDIFFLGVIGSGAFDLTDTFSVPPSTTSADFAVYNFELPTFLTFDSFSFAISGVGGVVFDSGVVTAPTNFGNFALAAGDYTINFVGDTGLQQGSFNLQISPVPEASTIALMLSGLGVVGFMTRRKKRNS